jgi:hypothetical protein
MTHAPQHLRESAEFAHARIDGLEAALAAWPLGSGYGPESRAAPRRMKLLHEMPSPSSGWTARQPDVQGVGRMTKRLSSTGAGQERPPQESGASVLMDVVVWLAEGTKDWKSADVSPQDRAQAQGRLANVPGRHHRDSRRGRLR